MISLGRCCAGEPLDLVEIDAPVIGADAIGDRIEPFARKIRPRAVRQMAARSERHSEDGVARLEERDEHGLIRLRTGMRLHIGEACTRRAAWHARSRAFRRHRQIRTRRNTGVRDSLRHICWSLPSLELPAPRERRCSRWRSTRSGIAGARARSDGRCNLRIGLEQCVRKKMVGDGCVNRGMG